MTPKAIVSYSGLMFGVALCSPHRPFACVEPQTQRSDFTGSFPSAFAGDGLGLKLSGLKFGWENLKIQGIVKGVPNFLIFGQDRLKSSVLSRSLNLFRIGKRPLVPRAAMAVDSWTPSPLHAGSAMACFSSFTTQA
jgi:hypothetical protein